MKRSVLHVLSLESLAKMPTKQLLGRLRRLHECEQSASFSDLTPAEIVASKGILFKDSSEWRAAYQQLKSLLTVREHVSSSAERAAKREQRSRTRSERKSNKPM